MQYNNELHRRVTIGIKVYNFFFLNYKYLIKVEKVFQIPWEDILKIKYPGFYIIINTLKREFPIYKNYAWETAYELIDRIETYIHRITDDEREKMVNDVKSEDPERVQEMLIMGFSFPETQDITAAYTLYTDINNSNYIKYIKYMPKINGINNVLFPALNEYLIKNDDDIKDTIEYIEDFKHRIDSRSDMTEFHEISKLLISLFLYMLDNPDKSMKIKERLMNLRFDISSSSYRNHDRDVLSAIMIHNYIVEFFND